MTHRTCRVDLWQSSSSLAAQVRRSFHQYRKGNRPKRNSEAGSARVANRADREKSCCDNGEDNRGMMNRTARDEMLRQAHLRNHLYLFADSPVPPKSPTSFVGSSV